MSIYQVLKKYWNFDSFRPLQEDIILSILEGRDTLALLPTGGGKSVCFQVPALAMPGICIVVSPLIALMKDQVENLKARGIEAVAIVSGMGKREVDILLDNCVYGPIKFLYLSPERLMSDLVRERIRYMNVNLFAVDEAHCISQWGYDFRPPYLELANLRELHPKVPVLALTATATEFVVEDIQVRLAFKKKNVFRKSFERKNLSYIVSHEDNKLRKLFAIANKVPGTGIVYVRNRRETQEVARQLNAHGIQADYYHAGIPGLQRSEKQEAWKNNEVRVIVATNAFGMGIDKPDVRFVVHLDLPESLEAYYQEAGRAGRDEKKAFGVLLYNKADRLQLERKLELSFPSAEEIKQVYHFLGNYFQLAYESGEGLTFEFDIADFCSRYKLEPIKTLNIFKFLEHDGYISLTESVYLPSRVKIAVGNEELYRFQIEYANYDAFIKMLLRSYGGMFDQYAMIREADLAKRVGMRFDDVVKTLDKLEQLEIISYLKQTDKPQIFFSRARVDTQNLHVDTKYIRQRKEVMQQQVNAVLEYAEVKKCRSIMLLRYFDETSEEKCGVCDVCIAEKRSESKETVDARISYEILEILAVGHFTIDELLVRITVGSEAEKIAAFRNLLDAGKLKIDGEKYYL
ncbi:RecQ family ATP-dependent DNA helicase [Desertivirga arenae]|uniref:RecQ family ATP-dependent DNA helicase n=1 Tax=Desertivirga arenae TaxID=2810309 RepID=UPI001A95E474|nr:ATP-dependent DNA helicase RecQ [Pedobacter sp. SYSU D00823]